MAHDGPTATRPVPEDRPLRALARTPHVAVLFTASLLARLPFTVAAVLLILRTRELGGSYAEGGAVVASYTVASGVIAPVLSRVIDRVGQTRVLVIGIPLNTAAFLATAVTPSSTPTPVLCLLAVAIGGSYPQVGGMIRTLFATMDLDAARRHAAYALESTGVELLYILTPSLLIGGVASQGGTSAAFVTAALIAFVGSVAFAANPASRAWGPERGAQADGPPDRARLVSVAYAAIVAQFVALGTAFGAIEVVATAFAEHHAHRSSVGFLLALGGFGSLLGGLVAARIGPAARPMRRMTALLTAQTASTLLLAAPRSMPEMGVAMLLSGATIAPTLALTYGIMGDLIPPSRMTEGYAWVGSALMSGGAIGVVAAGSFISAGSSTAAIVVVAAPLGVAAAVALRAAT